MDKEIKFVPFDHTKCDIESKDGEIQCLYGLTVNENGSLTNAIADIRIKSLPIGYTAIAKHEVGDHVNLILTRSQGVNIHNIYWCSYDCVAPTDVDIHFLGNISLIKGIEIYNNSIVLATDAGLVHLIWNGAAYNLFHALPNQLEIEFGLQKAGALVCSDKIQTKSSILSFVSSTSSGNSASQVHPTVSEDKEDTINLSDSVIASYKSAVSRLVDPKGYIHQPMLVRYAFRLHNGSYIMPSSPVLLLPTVLPPRISVSSTEDSDGTSTLSIDLTGNNYFELRYRVNSNPDQHWCDIINSVDIFASEQFGTYSDDITSGHITTFQSVISASSLGTHRGRVSRDNEDNAVFEGHYSLAGDSYTDHYIQQADTHMVWFISPNAQLQDQILNNSDYNLIASIPYEKITQMEDFEAVPLLKSNLCDASAKVDLDSCAQRTAVIIPSAIKRYAGRLIVASNSQSLMPPMGLRGIMSSCSSANNVQPTEVKLTVHLKHQGNDYSTSSTASMNVDTLSEYLPRYLYYPDPRAYSIDIEHSGLIFSMSLTPHNTLPGAYWFGGLETEIDRTNLTQCAVTGVRANSPSIIPTAAKIYTTAVDNDFNILDHPLTIESHSVTALASAISAPQGGYFGLYPLYALTTDGIFMLKYDDLKGIVTSARMISPTPCYNQSSITMVDKSIIFASDKEIFSIEGSSVKNISAWLSSLHFDVCRLPHYAEIFKLAGLQQIVDNTDDYLKDCICHYDVESKVLIVANPRRDYSFVYNPAQKSWSTIDLAIRGKVRDASAHWLVNSDNDIVSLSSHDQQSKGLLLTRAIKVDHPVAPNNITEIEILGDFEPYNVSIVLYGANRLNDWHLISTSKTHHLRDHNSCTYRYYRILLLTHLQPHEYIYGTKLYY